MAVAERSCCTKYLYDTNIILVSYKYLVTVKRGTLPDEDDLVGCGAGEVLRTDEVDAGGGESAAGIAAVPGEGVCAGVEGLVEEGSHTPSLCVVYGDLHGAGNVDGDTDVDAGVEGNG